MTYDLGELDLGRRALSCEKVVVFSAWTRLLALAADALTSRGVASASLVGSAELKQAALRRFGAMSSPEPASGPACDVLLVPLYGGAAGAAGSGAAGLNLQVASVAVLLEPCLTPGIEEQV